MFVKCSKVFYINNTNTWWVLQIWCSVLVSVFAFHLLISPNWTLQHFCQTFKVYYTDTKMEHPTWSRPLMHILCWWTFGIFYLGLVLLANILLNISKAGVRTVYCTYDSKKMILHNFIFPKQSDIESIVHIYTNYILASAVNNLSNLSGGRNVYIDVHQMCLLLKTL